MLAAPCKGYTMGSCSVPWSVDNSDFPSVVEQSQQDISCSCIPFIIPYLWVWGVSYALCLLPSLLQCCPEVSLQLSLSCCSLLNAVLLVQGFGLLQPLLFRVFCIAPWDSLSALCALWNSLSSFPNLWLFPFVRCPSKHIYCNTEHDWLLL